MKYYVMADGSVVFQSEVDVEAAYNGVEASEELQTIKAGVDEFLAELEED